MRASAYVQLDTSVLKRCRGSISFQRAAQTGLRCDVPGTQSIAELLVGNALVLVLLLAEGVRAVSDGQLEPVSCTKWLYGIGGVFFVFIVMPPGVFGGREGVDPVIAFTICWTIIGCWTLRGIAN